MNACESLFWGGGAAIQPTEQAPAFPDVAHRWRARSLPGPGPGVRAHFL